MAFARAASAAREQAAPGGVGEVVVGRIAVAEVVARRGAPAGPGEGPRALPHRKVRVGRQRGGRRGYRRARRAGAARRGVGELRHHERARAAALLGITLRDQLLIGLDHGVARELRLAREHAARGQALSGGAPPVENRGAQRAVGLAVERSVAVEREPHAAWSGLRDWPQKSNGSWPFLGAAPGERLGSSPACGGPMILYSGPLSLFTAKVRIALDEKALAYARVEGRWGLGR